MNTILLIAGNTFKETIRSKVLYNILLFAIGVIFLSISFGEWSVFARVQVMEDFGLATMSIAGLLLAVFIGVGMLGREIANKTCYNVLSKPVRRYQFVAGKFLGLTTTLLLNFAIMAAVFWGTIAYMGGQVKVSLLAAVILLLVELAVVVSVSILFSVVTTPTLAAVFTLGFYIIGHYNDMLEVSLMKQQNPMWEGVLKTIYFLLPNLEHFNVRARVVYGLGVGWDYVGLSVLYGALYTGLFLLVASVMLDRKDL
jgi:ABC-type transport system involved in multi-copper enzyme maturation permease subunit